MEQHQSKLLLGQYAPDPQCHRCKGTGDPHNPKNPTMGCICTYIKDREFREAAASAVSNTVKQLRQEFEVQGIEHPMVKTVARLLEQLMPKIMPKIMPKTGS